MGWGHITRGVEEVYNLVVKSEGNMLIGRGTCDKGIALLQILEKLCMTM